MFFFTLNIFALDIESGNIRLIINEKTGGYSLFYLTDPDRNRYEPLLYSDEPEASYLSVNVNDFIYQLGKSKEFTAGLEEENGKAVITYQSSFFTVTETITPVTTFSFPVPNGIQIDITLHNTGIEPVSAGLRMLLDTILGEGRRSIPFTTNNRDITEETIIESSAGELYWISRSENLSLMGTIVNPFNDNSKTPEYVHFANWKRLDTAKWELDYIQGRSFTYMPYFTNDSAVCYYFGKETLFPGDYITYTVFLTTEDTTWYNIGSDYDFMSYQPQSIYENTAAETEEIIELPGAYIYTDYTEPAESVDPDYQLLLRMQDVLVRFLAGEIFLGEQELDEIEGNINRLKIQFR